MAYGSNPRERYSYGEVSDQDRRRFLIALGAAAGAGIAGNTLNDLRSGVESGSAAGLAEMGQAVHAGLTGTLNASLLGTEMAALTDQIARLSELQAMGIPDRGETPYHELTAPAWRIENHLAEVGFFASAEENLPAFTPEHIETTTRQLLNLESLDTGLTELGFSDQEQMALVVNIVNASDQLSWWMPTVEYPPREAVDGAEEGVVYEYVAPLHQRGAAGALLWIDGLDWYLWQNEVLITQEIIDRGLWDIKSMLGGFYLLSDAAFALAQGSITDDQLTTLITASTAIMIIGQEFLLHDVVRIGDDERAPRAAVTGGEA